MKSFLCPNIADPDSNCGTNKTPLWRRSPQGATICNACGLYLKARNASRPTNLKRPPTVVATGQETSEGVPAGSSSAQQTAADQTCVGSCPGGGRCNGTGGAEGCTGCPAYNNRISKSTHYHVPHDLQSASTPQSQGEQPTDAPSPVDIAALQAQQQIAATAQSNATSVVACQNCGTTITPLWRRDASGHTICNACGTYSCKSPHFWSYIPTSGCIFLLSSQTTGSKCTFGLKLSLRMNSPQGRSCCGTVTR